MASAIIFSLQNGHFIFLSVMVTSRLWWIGYKN